MPTAQFGTRIALQHRVIIPAEKGDRRCEHRRRMPSKLSGLWCVSHRCDTPQWADAMGVNPEEQAMLPIRNILHPNDFSQHSAEAFQLACALARDYDAGLTVLHVIEVPLLVYTGVMSGTPPPLPSAEERQAVMNQLKRIKPPDPTIYLEHQLEAGDPATAILQVAQERRSDLIVMGTHGRRGLGHLLLGSVAEQVLRGASCPVLTVRPPDGHKTSAAAASSKAEAVKALRTILHPTDFSASSGYAFQLASALARDHGARIHVLHVGRSPIVTSVEGIVPPEPEHYYEELAESLHAVQADPPNVAVDHQLLLVGEPDAEIIRVAEALNVDLIVMGTHGRTGLGRLLMGSVAEHVVRRAPCPVVTVKAPPATASTASEGGLAAAARTVDVPLNQVSLD